MAAALFQKPTPASGIFYAQTLMPALGGLGAAFNLTQAWAPLGSALQSTQNIQSIALLDAWVQSGVFLFLGASLIDENAFLARLAILTTQPQFRTARLMWIANPNSREDQWIVWNIRISESPDCTSRVGALALFDFENYALAIGAGSSFTPLESSFVITPPDPASIFLTVRYGEARLPAVPQGPVTISYVENPGCLTFPVEAGTSFFDEFDIGCRLFFPKHGDIGSIQHPVFAPTEAVALSATLDPFAPLDPSRTAFAFELGQPLSSHYRTNAGRPVTLTTMAGSRLLFTSLPESSQSAAEPYYIVPDGPFGIQAPGTPPRLLCGIFGSEFIELTGDSILTFVAGKPAFIPAYDPENGLPAGDGQVQFSLTSVAATSWAAVYSPANTLCYSAVPDGSGYFKPAASQDLSLLEYYGACSAYLPQSAQAVYPLLPYAGVQAQDFAATFTLEQRVLAPFRRQIIQSNQAASPTPPPTGDTDDIVAVTPQGMVAQFNSDGTQWKTLTVGGSESGPFQLTAIGDPLRSALLTNQQFVVISDPTAFIPHLENNRATIEIEGWQFTLDQARWTSYGAIVIVKNSPRSLHDLAADLNSWTLAAQFNAAPTRTQQQLLDILNQAEAKASTVDFEYFANTVANDPGWNGVLILNCPLTSFPPSFQGLSGAVNPSGLFAHHLGFNQTPVARTVMAQDTQVSSLFGLIDYTDDAPATGVSNFEFKVTLLEVLFRNSAVRNLAANADLYVRALFGSPVNAASRAPLKLKGTIESHGAATVLALVSAEGPRTLALDDSVLASVRIENTHFGTKTGGDGTGPITSRFDFWGGLQFATLQGPEGAFDLFSYADLSFSKMGADMMTGTGAQSQTFQFDPFAMSFDASASQLRPKSLAAQFPMQLKGFTISSDKTTPTGAGYLAAALTQIDVAPVSAPWYGLVFNLNLGTLGTLAADVGLVATFAAIWSPGSGTPRVFAGIQLPGFSGGQNQVSLMGILKVAMHSVELVQQGGNFVLLLDGLALKFLGKSLPPVGAFDFYLFGDPSGAPGATQLAWYGAYLKGQ